MNWDKWFISCSKSKSSAEITINYTASFCCQMFSETKIRPVSVTDSYCLHYTVSHSSPTWVCWCKSWFSSLMGLLSFLWGTVTDQAISCAQMSIYSAISPALILLDLNYCKYKANQRLVLKLFSSLTEVLPFHFSLMLRWYPGGSQESI